MTLDLTPLLTVLNRIADALEKQNAQAVRVEVADTPKPKKEKAKAAPPPEPETVIEAEPAIAEETEADIPDTPTAEEPAVENHGITLDDLKAMTKPLSTIPEAREEYKAWLMQNYQTPVTAGCHEEAYPAIKEKLAELQTKYL